MTSLPPAPAGLFDGAVHLFTVRAYFEDTDLSGVVYHANYLRWFERARSDMVRLMGMDQRAANEGGEGAWAVSEMEIRYRAPARLDDAVLIERRERDASGREIVTFHGRPMSWMRQFTRPAMVAKFRDPRLLR